MASGPITSWKIDGETMETVTDFSWGGSKITATGLVDHIESAAGCIDLESEIREHLSDLDEIDLIKIGYGKEIGRAHV